MNKSALIHQLKIDHEADPPTPSARRRIVAWPFFAAAGLAAVTGGAGWFALTRPDLTPVTTVTVKSAWSSGPARGATLLDAGGYVVARRAATVSSKVTGKVVEVLIEEGQRVADDQVIARLDDSNLVAQLSQAQAQAQSAEAGLRQSEIRYANALRRHQRSQRLHATGYLSEQALDDAKAAADTAQGDVELAQRQLQAARAAVEVVTRARADTIIRAPFAGVITVKAAQPGEMVSPVSAGGGFTRTGIGTIVDMDSLEVVVDVGESFISRVVENMQVSVRLNAYPDWDIPGEVIAVVPTADRAKATVSVRVRLKARDPRIVPDMGAHVAFLSAAPVAAPAGATRAVIVPASAVQTDEAGQKVVFVIAKGRAERRAVRVGQKTAEGQLIEAGLRAGDRVAVSGAGNLEDRARVREQETSPGGA